MKSQLVRKIFRRYYKKITRHFEEGMQGDRRVGKPRKVDITELECGHIFWQEKGGNLTERFCDVCFQDFLIHSTESSYKGKRRAEFWDKYLRRMIIGEDY